MIVTGAGRGIGAATARLGAERGYAVALNYRGSKERAEALAAETEAAGDPVASVDSMPMHALVEFMMLASDNNMAESLGRIAAPASLDVLGAALHDPVHWVRLRAGVALLRLGEPGRQVLTRAGSGGDADARDVARLLLSLPAWSLENVSA